jgi:hypothetical protein
MLQPEAQGNQVNSPESRCALSGGRPPSRSPNGNHPFATGYAGGSQSIIRARAAPGIGRSERL